MKKLRKKKQFCIHGHNTFICGRAKGNGQCNDCKKEVHKKRYKPHPKPKKKFCINGHEIAIVGRNKQGRCKECAQNYKTKWFKKNKKRLLIKQEKYRLEHLAELLEYRREYYEKNRDKIIEYQKQYVIEHPESHKIATAKYRKEHPEIYKIADLKQHTTRGLRAVLWGQEGILEFIKNTPVDYEDDHYIPLQGKKVSGLHVIWNLQYLTKLENNKKRNKANLKEISEWYGELLEKAGLK